MSHKEKKLIRKVVKNGRNSYYINIPKELVDELHIRERQKMIIERRGLTITLRDWKK